MSEKERINKATKDLEPYALAHRYYFAKIFKINKTTYKRIIRTLSTLKVGDEDNVLIIKIYMNYFYKDVETATVKELALSFQGYLSDIYCHSIWKKSPKHRPYKYSQIEW